MGCSNSSFIDQNISKSLLKTVRLDAYEKDQAFQLTVQQINLIKESWLYIDDPKELGVQIMTRIFTNHCEIRSKWIFANDLNTIEEIQTNSQVIYHATKIIEILSQIIAKLDSINTMDFKDIVKLGRSHYNYGVKPYDFEHFEECLLYCLEKKISDERVLNAKSKMAWKKLFWTIVAKLCQGIHNAEIDDLNKINNNSNKRTLKN